MKALSAIPHYLNLHNAAGTRWLFERNPSDRGCDCFRRFDMLHFTKQLINRRGMLWRCLSFLALCWPFSIAWSAPLFQCRRPKSPITVPLEQVAELLASTRNLKHRMLIRLLWGTGLRISEVVGDRNGQNRTLRIGERS